MPSGKEHYRLWKEARGEIISATAGLGLLALIATNNPELAFSLTIGTTAGYLLGSVITPDLDLISIDRGESLMIRSVLFLPVIAWSTLYARIMQALGGHRNFWSHFPGVSTAIRLAWFLFPLVVLAHFMGWLGNDYTGYVAGLWVGLTAADTIHAVADFKPVLIRKFRRKFRLRKRASYTRSGSKRRSY